MGRLKVFILIANSADRFKADSGKSTKPIFILDSFSSMTDGVNINNSEDIAPVLYSFNRVAEEHNICLILIDHATRNIDRKDGFKLEGNEGGKKRTTVTVNKYLPYDSKKPELGGLFLCERARGNLSGLKIGNKRDVPSINISNALDWLKKRYPDSLKDKISQTEFTTKTKNVNDKWVRDFQDKLFNQSLEGVGIKEKTMLSLKKEHK